jgi:uncharacterized protein (DUF1330 family)
VTDTAGYTRYMEAVPEIVEKYGGRYLVRGGEAHPLEGDWKLNRIFVLEFPDEPSLMRFYEAHDFAALKAQRQAVSHSRMIAVEGIDEALPIP